MKNSQGEWKAPQFEFQSTVFRFVVKGSFVEWSAHWVENDGDNKRHKYRVGIYRGGGLRGEWLCSFFINKSNSKDLIIQTMKAEAGAIKITPKHFEAINKETV